MSDEAVRAFFARHGREFNEPVGFLWRERGGQILGAWAYTGRTADTVQVHLAALPGGLNRELIRRNFTYCFQELAVKVILAFVPGSNPRALETGRKLGFRQVGQIEEIDLHILTMSRAECRWLEARRG